MSGGKAREMPEFKEAIEGFVNSMSKEKPVTRRTMFFGGYAKLPTGITAEELYKVVGVGLEIDPATGEIVDADCTLATSTAKKVFRQLITGRRIDADMRAIVDDLRAYYHGAAQKALITALRAIHEKYRATCLDPTRGLTEGPDDDDGTTGEGNEG
ncbi:MAG: DUF3870 domain-containing protein [Bacillota bacterium]|nr:DUF3870 domain-containing protein [Bacillota bacterium]